MDANVMERAQERAKSIAGQASTIGERTDTSQKRKNSRMVAIEKNG